MIVGPTPNQTQLVGTRGSVDNRKVQMDSIYSENSRQQTGKSKNNADQLKNAPKNSMEKSIQQRKESSPEGLKHLKIVEKYIQLEKKFGVKSKSIGNIFITTE